MNHTNHETLVLVDDACKSPEAGVWLETLKECRVRTLEKLEDISQEVLDRKCPPFPYSIATTLYHIAAIELDWLYVELLEQEFPDGWQKWFPYDVRDAQGMNHEVVGESLQHHLDRLNYVRDMLINAVKDMSLDELKRVRKLEPYDVAGDWVLQHLVQHEAEHRGQIIMLLRC